jgi:hypothetical protein
MLWKWQSKLKSKGDELLAGRRRWSLTGQERALAVTKSPPRSSRSRPTVSLGRRLWSPAELQGAHSHEAN